MKYILIRITILILAIISINYISDYIGEEAHEDFGYLFATIWFYRFLFALAIISLCIFSYEAYRFNKKNCKKERNLSLFLVAIVLLPLLACIKYFIEFAF